MQWHYDIEMNISTDRRESPDVSLYHLQGLQTDVDCLVPLEYIKDNLKIVISLACVKEITALINPGICKNANDGLALEDLFPDSEDIKGEKACCSLTDEDSLVFPVDDSEIQASIVEFLGDGVAFLAADNPLVTGDNSTTVHIKRLKAWNKRIVAKIKQDALPPEELLSGLRFLIGDSPLQDHFLLYLAQKYDTILDSDCEIRDISIKDSILLLALKEDPLRSNSDIPIGNIQNEEIKIEACKVLLLHAYQQDRGQFCEFVMCFVKKFCIDGVSQDFIHAIFLSIFQLQFDIVQDPAVREPDTEDGEIIDRSNFLSLLKKNLSKMTDSQREEIIACIINNTAFDSGFRIAVVEQNVDDPNIRESLTQSLGDSDDRKRLARTKSSRK